MTNHLRQALLNVHQQNRTVVYASESFSSIITDLMPFLSSKPKVADRDKHGHNTHAYFDELRANIDQYYGNPEWLDKRGSKTGMIGVADVMPLFTVNGHAPSPLLAGIRKEADDIVQWCKDFTRINNKRQPLAAKYLRQAKGKSEEEMVAFLTNKLPELPSPLAEIGDRVRKLPGNYVLSERDTGVGKVYTLLHTPYRHRDSPISVFTKKEIEEGTKTIHHLIDKTMEAWDVLVERTPGEEEAWEGLGISADDYFQMSHKAIAVSGVFSEEIFDASETSVAYDLIRHLVKMMGGVEKLLHRSV